MTTVYIAQSFGREGRKLVAYPQQSHKTADAAIASARYMIGKRAGAVAFSVTGSMDADHWEDPVILFKGGELPLELQGDEAGDPSS